MDLNLQITDMAGARPEHSTVIVNFVATVRNQLKNSMCYVFSDNVQYKFKADDGEKKELYRQQEIDEYWIVDLHKKQVEIYELDYDEKEEPQYYLWKTVTEENKNELKIIHFPNLKITFDDLFYEVDIEY